MVGLRVGQAGGVGVGVRSGTGVGLKCRGAGGGNRLFELENFSRRWNIPKV